MRARHRSARSPFSVTLAELPAVRVGERAEVTAYFVFAEALAKSKDLRLLAYLGTAVLRTEGLPSFAAVLTTASNWLETYWPQVYPLLDEDAIDA